MNDLAPTGLNLSAATKPSFTRVIARYVFLVIIIIIIVIIISRSSTISSSGSSSSSTSTSTSTSDLSYIRDIIYVFLANELFGIDLVQSEFCDYLF